MKRPLCRLCSERHYTHEGHKLASNGASNKPESASNTSPVTSLAGSAPVGLDAARGGVAIAPKQRWPREVYNAYMREYMAKRRTNA